MAHRLVEAARRQAAGRETATEWPAQQPRDTKHTTARRRIVVEEEEEEEDAMVGCLVACEKEKVEAQKRKARGSIR